MRMRTIQYRLTRKLLLTLTAVIVAASAGVFFTMREALVEQFDQTLRAKADAVSSVAEQHGATLEVELAEGSLREFDEGVPVEFFQVWDATGKSIRRSQSLGETNLLAAAAPSPHRRYWNLLLPTGKAGRAVKYQFAPAGADGGVMATVVYAVDREELDESLRTLAWVLAGFVAVSMAAVLVTVPRVLRRELAPLNQFADQVTRIDASTLSQRFPVETVPGELQPISERLNLLMARLEESFERERRFSGDLAHELRTPIAELRNLAEVALKWPESRAGTDEDVFDIAVQMEGIVTRLLELLRCETEQVAVKPEPVSLSRLWEQVWQACRARAEAKRLDVKRIIPADATVQSDAVLLGSILANLADNAVEYTPAGGSIEMHARVDNRLFTLRISNTVENLTPEDVSQLFDRFWRKDKARSDARHNGLGLSLSRAFAQVLRLQLTASLEGQNRLVLTLQGPSGA
jgi:signal transduction histidine kinase